jgi:hypothetical protein
MRYISLQPGDNSGKSHRAWRAYIVHISSEIAMFRLVTGFWGHISKACVVKATVGSNPTLSAKSASEQGLRESASNASRDAEVGTQLPSLVGGLFWLDVDPAFAAQTSTLPVCGFVCTTFSEPSVDSVAASL